MWCARYFIKTIDGFKDAGIKLDLLPDGKHEIEYIQMAKDAKEYILECNPNITHFELYYIANNDNSKGIPQTKMIEL